MKSYSLFWFILLFPLFLVSCHHADEPPQPPPPSPVVKHYNLYAANQGLDEVYVIDTDSDRVTDTLRGFGSVMDITPTRSGKKLYVTTSIGLNGPGAVFSVNPVTKSITQIYSKVSDVYIRPDGVPLIIASTPYDTMRQVGVIDTMTDAVTFFDTLGIMDRGYNYEAVAFAPNSPVLYTWTNQGWLFAYNYSEKRIERYFRNAAAQKMVISPDGKFLYCSRGTVVDIDHDSCIAYIGGGSSPGSLALSPDGQTLFITDPGSFNIEVVPSGKIFKFRTTPFAGIGFIDMSAATGIYWMITDCMRILPEGKRAFVSDGFATIFEINIGTNKITNMIQFVPYNMELRSLAYALR